MQGFYIHATLTCEEEAFDTKNLLESIEKIITHDLIVICEKEFKVEGEVYASGYNLKQHIEKILIETKEYEIKEIYPAKERAISSAVKRKGAFSTNNCKIENARELQSLFLTSKPPTQKLPKISQQDFWHAHQNTNLPNINLVPYDSDRSLNCTWESLPNSFDPCQVDFLVYYKEQEIGKMSRRMITNRDGEVEEVRLENLYINPQINLPKGLGVQLQRESIRTYQKLGVKMVSLTAVEAGSYVWAKEGFIFDVRRTEYEDFLAYLPDLSAASDPDFLSACCAYKLFADSKTHLELYMSDKDIRKASKLFLDPKAVQQQKWTNKLSTPQSILNAGKDMVFEVEGEKVWLGKFLLVHSMQRAFDSAVWCRTGCLLNGTPCPSNPAHTPGWAGVKFIN